MIAIETIAASATAPGAGGAAMAAVSGDSLRIRDSASARLLAVGGLQQAAGRVRITSPLLHDNTVGVKYETGLGAPYSMFAIPPQPLVPQDTLSLNVIGSAVAGDVELSYLTIMYEDLAGINANLIGLDELMARGVELFQPELTPVGAAAGWTGSQVITTTDDAYKSLNEYAWVGVTTRTTTVNFAAVGMISPDWGNLRIACMPQFSTDIFEAYFVKMSYWLDAKCIPVFNSSQKSNIFISILQNENNVSPILSLMLVRLGQRGAGGARKRR